MQSGTTNLGCLFYIAKIFFEFATARQEGTMPRNLHIGLIFDYDTGYCRGVLRGIKQYAEAMPHWVLIPVVADSRAVRALGKLRVDGLISSSRRPRAGHRTGSSGGGCCHCPNGWGGNLLC
jgi:hypothetical protein